MGKNQRHNKEQMYALIQKWEKSGMSQEKFFNQHAISKSTFGYWRKKYLKETSRSKAKDNFIPVKVGHPRDKRPEVLEVVYPNGVRLVCSANMDLARLKPLIVL